MTTTFSDLGLSEKMLKKIEAKGYKAPSEIQAGVIPLLLNGDKDIVGQAQTGTGKTAAFALPILERIDPTSNGIQALILAPTRELAIQVAAEIESFAGRDFKILTIYGGQPISGDLRELRRNPQIIVGTPGRVKDHIVKKKSLKLENMKYFILDEADEMLNIGFKEEIEEIMEYTPKEKKVLLFSATMPREILNIAHKYMGDYDTVKIEKKNLTNASITQKHYEVAPRDKFDALCRIIDLEESFYSIIFCKTKMDVDDVASRLVQKGYPAEGIHGDVEQKGREKILRRFKEKKITVLVATDVAARGIDVNDVTHVINYSLPDNPETYTHRIGRTGRAGKDGIAITLAGRADFRKLNHIERIIKAKIPKEHLPNAKEVIVMKKKRLVTSIEALITTNTGLDSFSALAEAVLKTNEDPKLVVQALLQQAFKTDFDEASYKNVIEKDFSNRPERADRNRSNFSTEVESGEQRIFIAKGKKDDMNPGSLIQFLERSANMNLGDVGKIDILDNFSYMNLQSDKAQEILTVFKELDPRKPLVVQAKARTNGGGGTGGRSGGYRGSRDSGSRGSSRGGRDSGGRGGYQGRR